MPESQSASDANRILNPDAVPSPALLVYPDRIEENIRRMIELTGGPDRLRPHVKTHKLPEIVRLHLAAGVTRFKCATIPEVEMVAECQAPDILLAFQPVGPSQRRLLDLALRFPQTKFSAIADDPDTVKSISATFAGEQRALTLLLDVDCGMRRSGIAPGKEAVALYELIASLPGVEPGGIHAYDGHRHERDLDERIRHCEADFEMVSRLLADLERGGLPVPTVVAGGTPSFPVHARRKNVECSPGTCVLWDAGYGTNLPDMKFLHAAVLLMRVTSKPTSDRLCLDLGHKSVASENPNPRRVQFPDIPDANPVVHSEEHLVIETADAGKWSVGDVVYGIPWHICPTTALYSHVDVVRDRRAVERWRVTARDRSISV